jgi:salicylate hydroxylase
MSKKPHILIAGAGIGGLSAGLALLQRGFDVEIFDQAEELRGLGAGVQISANGTRVLHALGIGRESAAIAWEPQGKEIRLWSTGQTWKLFDLAAESVKRYGYPYLMFHRADLHRVLADGVTARKADAIRLGHRVVGVDQDRRGATLRFANGGSARGDVVIGADGVHSIVRSELFGADRPSFTGLIAWRGVMEAAKLPAGLMRPVGTNWVGPHRHVVHYFLRRGELLNFVGIVERDDWQVESWTTKGTHAECAADFAGWHPDVLTLIRHMDVPYKWALMGREPMPNWVIGRTSLLGDAAHPTLPFMAQGAQMAMEDGLILGRCLEQYPDIDEALQHYQAARRERTARVVRASSDNAKRFHNPALANADTAADYVDREWQPQKVSDRYDWLFMYDATRVDV